MADEIQEEKPLKKPVNETGADGVPEDLEKKQANIKKNPDPEWVFKNKVIPYFKVVGPVVIGIAALGYTAYRVTNWDEPDNRVKASAIADEKLQKEAAKDPEGAIVNLQRRLTKFASDYTLRDTGQHPEVSEIIQHLEDTKKHFLNAEREKTDWRKKAEHLIEAENSCSKIAVPFMQMVNVAPHLNKDSRTIQSELGGLEIGLASRLSAIKSRNNEGQAEGDFQLKINVNFVNPEDAEIIFTLRRPKLGEEGISKTVKYKLDHGKLNETLRFPNENPIMTVSTTKPDGEGMNATEVALTIVKAMGAEMMKDTKNNQLTPAEFVPDLKARLEAQPHPHGPVDPRAIEKQHPVRKQP